MSKGIDITIGTRFVASGIDAAKRGLAAVSAKAKAMSATVGRNLMNIKAGFDMAAAAVRTFLAAMEKGMAFERMTFQFKTLTGSMELAKAHMRDLQDLGRTPPFSLEEFAAASREMMKMTGGAAGFRREMEIVGDLAAATGNDISTVGRAFGLAYQVIRDGQPFGRAGQQLFTLGIMTKAQVAEFDALSKSGASNIEIWNKLEQVFNRYKGAMAETEKTTKGVVEAIQGEAAVAITEFSKAISDNATPALQGVLDLLKRINEDGSIEIWAEDLINSFDRIAEGAKSVLGPAFTVVGNLWKMVKSTAEATAQAAGNAFGTAMEGGSLKEIGKAAWNGWESGSNDVWDFDGQEARSKKERRKKLADEKSKKRVEESARVEAEAKKRIEKDMASASEDRQYEEIYKAIEEQKKAEEKAAEEASAQRMRDHEEAVKKQKQYEDNLRKSRIETERKVLKERIEAARKAHKEQMDALEKEKQKAEEQARKWEESAQRAREFAKGGGGFAKWNAGERDIQREAERDKRKQEGAIKNAKNELDRLTKDAGRGKAFNTPQLQARIAALKDFIDKQDPKKNPGLNKAEQIAKKQLSETEKMNKNIEKLTGQMSALGL